MIAAVPDASGTSRHLVAERDCPTCHAAAGERHVLDDHARPPSGIGRKRYDEILAIAGAKRPIHPHGVTYELVGTSLTGKERTEEKSVSAALVWAREVGDLDWEAVVDQRATWKRQTGWENADELARAIAIERCISNRNS